MTEKLYTQVQFYNSERNNEKSKTSNYFNKNSNNIKPRLINPSEMLKTPLKSPERTKNPKDFLKILQSIKDSTLFKSSKKETEIKPPLIQPNITIKLILINLVSLER